jgi:hypothetical protein
MPRNSSVGIATGYGLDGRGLIPGRGSRSFLHHSVQTGSEAHPLAYKMGTGGYIPADRAARA